MYTVWRKLDGKLKYKELMCISKGLYVENCRVMKNGEDIGLYPVKCTTGKGGVFVKHVPNLYPSCITRLTCNEHKSSTVRRIPPSFKNIHYCFTNAFTLTVEGWEFINSELPPKDHQPVNKPSVEVWSVSSVHLKRGLPFGYMVIPLLVTANFGMLVYLAKGERDRSSSSSSHQQTTRIHRHTLASLRSH